LHPKATPMNFLYVLAALIALALAVYLTVALLKPEWFE
jgi:K+-transporting ATPase KdpF subunit